ncbi:hypothetical protein BPP43_11765 [Brachyspira pilosicoli P43/6/78]|uniref:Uncharacterized protein n=1 Tax=Brachyspira pilosicoli P43/6/78 TaxID=1042417 RepID=A0A3B6W550_BRAPL|nr:hypothetical protein BPP43_11765 [Brachyspira pilosicoli P43/6/78]
MSFHLYPAKYAIMHAINVPIVSKNSIGTPYFIVNIKTVMSIKIRGNSFQKVGIFFILLFIFIDPFII